MSAISEFVAKQNAFNDRLDASIAGIIADVDGLKKLIEELQSNPGPITPADQALLDQLQERVAGIAGRLEALDAQTPPPVPVP